MRSQYMSTWSGRGFTEKPRPDLVFQDLVNQSGPGFQDTSHYFFIDVHVALHQDNREIN